MKYEDSQELADKIDWEGGLTAFVFGYGISLEDLPGDMPGDIRDAFARILAVHEDIRLIREYLPEPDGE